MHGGRVYNQLLIPPPAREGIILPPTRPVNDTAGRIFVIFVDDLHLETSKTPRIRQVFETLADTLIHEGDLFGIVSTGPSSISIDMTYDRSLLSLAADRITGDGFNPTEMIQYLAEGASGPSELQWRAHVAFKTAREIVQNLEQVQNRRKAFIYFSSGYDFNPFAHERIFARSPMAQAMRQDIEQGFDRDELEDLYDGVADPLTDPFEQITRRGQVFSDAELAMEISELTKAANRANASFYTVDPRGLVAGPDIDYQGPTQAFNNFLSTTQNSLRALAELTGGMAVVNRNDFDDAFKEIDADTSDYYILASIRATPTRRTARGGFGSRSTARGSTCGRAPTTRSPDRTKAGPRRRKLDADSPRESSRLIRRLDGWAFSFLMRRSGSHPGAALRRPPLIQRGQATRRARRPGWSGWRRPPRWARADCADARRIRNHRPCPRCSPPRGRRPFHDTGRPDIRSRASRIRPVETMAFARLRQ